MKAHKKPREINISDFKAQLLSLVEETRRYGKEFVLLKHGKPIARVLPFSQESSSFLDRLDSLKGKVHIVGDIVNCSSAADWDALQ